MPRFIDHTHDEPLSKKSRLLRTRLEVMAHQQRIAEIISKNIGGILQKITVEELESGRPIKVIVSSEDPGFVFANPEDVESGQDAESGQTTQNLDDLLEKKPVEVAKGSRGKQGRAGRGGDESEGELSFKEEEFEINQQDLADELLRKANLPADLFRRIKGKKPQLRYQGIKMQGPPARFNRRATYLEKLKRDKRLHKKTNFQLSDKRYYGLKPRPKGEIKGVVFFVRDKSGSMNDDKVELMTGLMLLIYLLLKRKYESVELVFVVHDTKGYVVDMERFWQVESQGGTFLSSGLKKVLQIIQEKFNPKNWNIYIFQFSDGENSGSDWDNYRETIKECLEYAKFFGYTEVQPFVAPQNPTHPMLFMGNTVFSSILDLAESYNNFHPLQIFSFTDLGEAFLKLFEVVRKEGGR